MASLFTPSRSSSTIPNLKLTPTSGGSPGLFSQRSGGSSTAKSAKRLSNIAATSAFPDSTLSLKRVIGCSTNAFDSHPPTRSFAYTAGAAAVVVTLDEDLQITQRFFRARPNAPTLATAAAGAYHTPSTPQNDSRVRAAASLREAGIGYSPCPAGIDDSSGGKTWSARERIKAATSLSFSPDGKWLAVGETGYNPRVLIFSMSKDVPSDVPVAAMSEHTFGVRGVAFSPDSKFLASIGTANDGFIYIWSLNPSKPGLVQLHASNKCTSYIRQIAWMGRSLITVGTRHVKLWRTEDDVRDGRKTKRKWRLTRKQQKPNPTGGPVVLHGRNALLGNMSDSTMSCVVAVAEDKAIVCSERGDICLLEETGLRFSKVADAGFAVHCIAVDTEKKFAWVAGANGSHSSLVLANIVPPTPPASPSSSRSSSPVLPSGCRKADVLAMASMFGHLFTLDSNRSLKVISMSTVEGIPVPNSMVRDLPAHKDACLGVRSLPPNHDSEAAFFTWSAGGAVLFWNLDGICKAEFQIEVEQPTDADDEVLNELKVVRVSKDGGFFVSGDKYGVLRVIDGKTRENSLNVKAHGGEVMDIVIHNNTIVSCARDRTVQVFIKVNQEWILNQTLDDHTASVQRVLLLEDGNKLLSCSTDRTIVMRELCSRETADGSFQQAYVPYRTLNTKASPIHMAPLSDSAATLMVSTLDRQIIKYDMNNCKILSSFKVTDDSGDPVVMDAITLSADKGKARIIVGTSTTDKSIRLYDFNGGLVDKEWGHTEGVSDVCLLETDATIDRGESVTVISTGTDGTIMIWDFTPKSAIPASQPSPLEAPSNSRDLTTRTPLRRVLSKSELVDFSPSRATTPSVGSSSPPRERPLRKKSSLYGLSRPINTKPGLATTQALLSAAASSSEDSSTVTPSSRRESGKGGRDRTPSPPEPRLSATTPRRPSYETKARGKSRVRGKSDPNAINTLAESLTRSLRSFRKKIDAAEAGGVKPEILRDLQRELGLAAKGLGKGEQGKEGKEVEKEKVPEMIEREKEPQETKDEESASSSDEDPMVAMLELYSKRLLGMVGERLEGLGRRECLLPPVRIEEHGIPPSGVVTPRSPGTPGMSGEFPEDLDEGGEG